MGNRSLTASRLVSYVGIYIVYLNIHTATLASYVELYIIFEHCYSCYVRSWATGH